MSHPPHDDDALASARAERIELMVGNLLPRVRPLSGQSPEEALREAASYMAAARTADDDERPTRA